MIKKKKPDRKKETKKANSALRHVRTDFRSMMSEERLNSFMTDVLITSPLIYRVNHWTGFYTTGTSVMKEFMLCYLHVFIEMYIP